MKSSDKLEKAIEDLELRNAFQEDVIEQLNTELSVHQSEISELKQQLKLLAKRIQSNSHRTTDDTHELPPHY